MLKLFRVAWMVGWCAAGGAHAGEVPSDGHSVVKIVDFMRFEPATLTVAPGATVTWVNQDGSNHVIQLRSGAKSPRLRHDATFSHRFDIPGEYPYVCAIHGDRMNGTIVVRAP